MVTIIAGGLVEDFRVAIGVTSSQEGADCFGWSRVAGSHRVLVRKTSGSDKYVDFRSAPRGIGTPTGQAGTELSAGHREKKAPTHHHAVLDNP